MSFHSSSTQSSPESFEDTSSFENITSNALETSPESGFPDSEKVFFYEHFPESQNKGVEFFSVFEKVLSPEKEPSRIRSFRYKQNIYALSASNMGRSLILELIKTGENQGMDGIYLALDRRVPGFMNQFKMVSYAGFKQVNPKIQKFITSTKCFLVVYMSFN
jgi:hypothetical protein